MGHTRRQVTRSLMFLVLCVVVVVMLFPFVFMVLTAFKSEDQYISGNGFSLDSWAELFNVLPVVQELINSTVVTAGAVVLIIAVSTTGGFAFAKLGFRGSGMVFLAILAGMMIPMQSIIIPEFVNIARVAHLNNQYLGAVLVDDVREAHDTPVRRAIEHQRVERDVAAHAAPVQELHQRRQIRLGEIVGAHPGVELVEAEINRVRAVFDRGAGAIPIAGGREDLRAEHPRD